MRPGEEAVGRMAVMRMGRRERRERTRRCRKWWWDVKASTRDEELEGSAGAGLEDHRGQRRAGERDKVRTWRAGCDWTRRAASRRCFQFLASSVNFGAEQRKTTNLR